MAKTVDLVYTIQKPRALPNWIKDNIKPMLRNKLK